MKQTAVEWLEDIINKMESYGGDLPPLMIHIKQAKEMEKQQQDEFAIGFAEWCVAKAMGTNNFKLYEGELEIYKKEKGL
jgi:hypothetical protein